MLFQSAVVRQVLRKELGLKIVECEGNLEGGDVLWTGDCYFFNCALTALSQHQTVHGNRWVTWATQLTGESRLHLVQEHSCRVIQRWRAALEYHLQFVPVKSGASKRHSYDYSAAYQLQQTSEAPVYPLGHYPVKTHSDCAELELTENVFPYWHCARRRWPTSNQWWMQFPFAWRYKS